MEKKKSKLFPAILIIFLFGLVMLIVGIVLMSIVGWNKYYPTTDIKESFDATNIENLHIDNGRAKFTVESYDGDKILVEGSNVPENRYTIECTDDTFSIDYSNGKWYKWYENNFNFGLNIKSYNTVFKIYLPDKVYEELEFDGGIGQITISDVRCVDSDISIGIGETIFNNCVFSGETDIDGGVGSNRFKNCTFGSVVARNGVGELKLQGKITKSLDVECGVGTCYIDIDGYYSDYKVDYDKGLGEFKTKYNDSSKRENTGDKIPINVQCGVGEVTVNFK